MFWKKRCSWLIDYKHLTEVLLFMIPLRFTVILLRHGHPMRLCLWRTLTQRHVSTHLTSSSRGILRFRTWFFFFERLLYTDSIERVFVHFETLTTTDLIFQRMVRFSLRVKGRWRTKESLDLFIFVSTIPWNPKDSCSLKLKEEIYFWRTIPSQGETRLGLGRSHISPIHMISTPFFCTVVRTRGLDVGKEKARTERHKTGKKVFMMTNRWWKSMTGSISVLPLTLFLSWRKKEAIVTWVDLQVKKGRRSPA